MKRRRLLIAAGALGALTAARAWAQPSKAPRLIGWFFSFTRESQNVVMKDFTTQLERLGHVEGRDFVIEGRWTDGNFQKLPALARELVALKPAAIVTAGTRDITALKHATDSVPIVFAGVFDPVASGFVASLGRPGGNITGVALRAELDAKLVELVRETLPAVRRVALVEHDNHPVSKRNAERFRQAASALRIEATSLRIERIDEIERAFAAAADSKVGALIESTATFSLLHAQKIGAAAARARLPLFSTLRGTTTGGGLLSYYSDIRETYRRCAVLVDKILRGASPADLAVEQRDRYSLVINQRTARALGIKVPQTVLLRADEVIE